MMNQLLIFIFSKEKTCDFYGFVSWLQTVILFISLYNLSPLKKKKKASSLSTNKHYLCEENSNKHFWVL